ncbi:MAG: tetratricopeptide repeat protein, partial [Desulfobacterales bacterium]|nr:tetratricopeptide repeat protein [Desulfobacterales bacterium]
MEKARRRLPFIFVLLIFISLTSMVSANQSDMEFLYLKNGVIIKCDAVWRGLGDYVWGSRSGGIKGYPADEVDLVMTFETQPVVNRLVNQSRTSFEKGNWDMAVKTASEALSLSPRDEVAYTNRSGAYANLGWYFQALADAEAAVKINPDFGLAYNNRGYAFEKMGKFPQARKDYETSCRLEEKLGCANHERLFASEIRPRVEKLLAQSHEGFLKGDWDAVISTANEALDLDPKSDLAYTNRAGAYTNKGLPEKALQDCDEAIKINPKLGLAYNNRGYALERLSRFIQASKEYNSSCGLGTELGCTNYARVFASEIKPRVEKLL